MLFNCAIYIPNVFSPNHDGSNDEFEPQVFNATITEMYIFDRWGKNYFIRSAITLNGMDILKANDDLVLCI